MKKSIIAAVVAAAISPAAMADEGITLKLVPGIKLADAVKEVKFQFGGRLQLDYNNSSLDDGNSDDTVDSNFDARRARLFVKGAVGDWGFKSQFNIDIEESDEGGSAEDLYIRYNGWGKQAKVTFGRQKESFGLEELISSKDITFLERNAITEAYAPGRNVGLQLSGDIDNLHYAIGIFEDGEDNEEAGNLATTARVAFAPINDNGSVLHLGLAYTDRSEDVSAYAVELAGVAGPFHAQAEFIGADLDDTVDAGEEDKPDGYYVQLGYVFTGESRPYKGGKFKRIKPAGENGAWEAVVRYADGEGNFSDTELGTTEASEYGVGVNWYANNNVRLGATYSISDEDGTDREGSEFRFRTQFVF